MAYKDFSQLNSALAAAGLSPLVDDIRRFFNSMDSITSMAKDLVSSWGRSYSGVMVLKYDQSGQPTDVTESQDFAHAIDVPNSLISDVKRRMSTEASIYNQLKQLIDSYVKIDLNVPELGTIQTDMCSDITDTVKCIASMQFGPDLWFSIGLNGSNWAFKISSDAEAITDGVLSWVETHALGQSTVFTLSSTFRSTNTFRMVFGSLKLDNTVNDTIIFDGNHQLVRLNANNFVARLNIPTSINIDTSFGQWRNLSPETISGSAILNTASSEPISRAIGNYELNFSDVTQINYQAIDDVVTAISNL